MQSLTHKAKSLRNSAPILPVVVVWLVFMGLLVARDPGIVGRPEFWGEDGWAWFPDAYNNGLASIAQPLAGYLQTVSRVVGLLAQQLPMSWAPALFAVVALALQALPPAFLVSARMQGAWPSQTGRLAFALVWIALPNGREQFANLTNSQWHLATLAFLVLLSDPPQGWPGRVWDTAVLALSGLSGPFCVLLLPVAVCEFLRLRSRLAMLRGLLLLLTAIVQAWTLLHTAAERSTASLGAEPLLLARIVAQQVLLAPFTGQAHMDRLNSLELWQSGLIPIAVCMGAVAVLTLALWRGPHSLRLACLLGGVVLAAALLRPQISMSGSQWQYMQQPGVGQRYYLIPMLAWLTVLFWLAFIPCAVPRLFSAVLAAGLLFGIWSDWSIPARVPTAFPKRAKAFLALPAGSAVAFPINPMMDLIPMILIRK